MNRIYGDLNEARQNPLFNHINLPNSLQHQIPIDPGPAYFSASTFRPHRLWRYSAFRSYPVNHLDAARYDDAQYDLARTLYDRIYPALQLATLMLQRSGQFFVRLLFCPVVNGTSFDPTWKPEQEDYDSLDDYLNILARTYRTLYILPQPPYTHDRPGVLGVTRATLLDLRPINALSSELLDQLHSDTWADRPAIQRANTLVGIAKTLLHEVAHAVFMFRRTSSLNGQSLEERNAGLFRREVDMPPEKIRELGRSCEYFLHGFRMTWPITLQTTRWDPETHTRPLFDGSQGLIAIIDPSASRNSPSFLWRWRSISLETVCSYFKLSTWQAAQMDFHLLDWTGAVPRWAHEVPDADGDTVMIVPGTGQAPQFIRDPDGDIAMFIS